MRIRIFSLLTGCLASGLAIAQRPVPPAVAPALSLEQAIQLAEANEPALALADAERRAAALERTNAHTALLPTVNYHNAAIYTKPNGVAASRIGQVAGADSPVFIANNAIREYASQGVVDEKLGLGQIASIRSTEAAALKADAEAEIARRGLTSVVMGLFWGLQSATEKEAVVSEAMTEANRFVELTQKREEAREVAHADVLKAQLQQQQRSRDLADARLQVARARVELATLLYPDPLTPYAVDASGPPSLLPDREHTLDLARKNNPELRSSLASLQQARANTLLSRAALAPDLALNFTYGIDATNFGVNGPDGIRNLGYSVGATLDVPVWDWLANERRLKENKLRENAAVVALSATQRRLLANLEEFYAEAELASQQLQSLQSSVATARESLRLTNLRYVDGESAALEVVDAEAATILAETASIDGRTRYEAAKAQLQTLTGTLP